MQQQRKEKELYNKEKKKSFKTKIAKEKRSKYDAIAILGLVKKDNLAILNTGR